MKSVHILWDVGSIKYEIFEFLYERIPNIDLLQTFSETYHENGYKWLE